MAVCLLESGGDDASDEEERRKRKLESKEEAAKLMVRVPGLRQKIAGKSIPLEVRVLFRFPTRSSIIFRSLLFFAFPRNSSHAKPVNSNRKTNI